ncbi:MAG: hypothetical protein AB7E80_06260 [Hyphomicrobiaceae bacterium]
MRKSILTLAATLVLAASAFSTSAEAGGHRGGFRFFHPGPSFSNSNHAELEAKKRARIRAAKIRAAQAHAARERAAEIRAAKLAELRQRAAEKRQALAAARIKAAAKRKALAIAAQQQQPVVEESKVSEVPVETPAPQAEAAPEATPEVKTEKVAAVDAGQEVGAATCKRFIPTAGLTIDVPCTE